MTRGEVDDVSEQDRCRAELVRNRLRLGLEPVGDRPRQDVEQQALRPRLLLSQRRERPPALGGEHGQQREHDRAAHRHVEGEHRAREPLGDGRRNPTQQLSGEPRAEEHDEVRDVPASRGSDVAENERPERGEDPPQADPAGGEEAPSGTIDSVGANRMASWPARRNWPKSRVREKTTIAASRIAKYTSGTQPTGDPNAR